MHDHLHARHHLHPLDFTHPPLTRHLHSSSTSLDTIHSASSCIINELRHHPSHLKLLRPQQRFGWPPRRMCGNPSSSHAPFAFATANSLGLFVLDPEDVRPLDQTQPSEPKRFTTSFVLVLDSRRSSSSIFYVVDLDNSIKSYSAFITFTHNKTEDSVFNQYPNFQNYKNNGLLRLLSRCPFYLSRLPAHHPGLPCLGMGSLEFISVSSVVSMSCYARLFAHHRADGLVM